ncbi:MAG: hypothetical protein HN919_12175 [Verrucomicrobia bacterium]|jgi:hypothetical protein|nr:hypothetical protein [Verrucomicrobiota bacterium]MBT7067055.1 hypothetical protein [Verrucomicrobiota bacterium]MBT7701003.1 hypothetical protein [Verrucomicrobiota bacterium]
MSEHSGNSTVRMEAYWQKRRDQEATLLANIKTALPRLEEALEKCSSHWGYEDPIYRFYHHSFKVYWLQSNTRANAELLRSLAPGKPVLDPFFEEILRAGATDKEFKREHNRDWLTHTRPFLEAFFHTRYFLEMAVKYGQELTSPPAVLPSGWAAILCLYNLR